MPEKLSSIDGSSAAKLCNSIQNVLELEVTVEVFSASSEKFSQSIATFGRLLNIIEYGTKVHKIGPVGT